MHPDHHPECDDCQQKFIAATKAYETLVDPEKKGVYDQTRGSYEPILSDFSVSLTSFNYENLVTLSPFVWVIQVYDDLDSHSKHFAQQWDAVAGSEIAQTAGIKFGRVNVRRDRAVLGRLPMRARTFPTVMMFSRNTMPTIFSIADTSSKALRRWVLAEVPSHLDETSSDNAYSLEIRGRNDAPTATMKAASVQYSAVFDSTYRKHTSVGVAVVSKKTGKQIVTTECGDREILRTIEAIKERLVIPLNRYNVYDVCTNQEAEVSSVYCVVVRDASEAVLPAPLVQNDILMQLVRADKLTPSVIDFQGSQLAPLSIPLDDLVIEDLRFKPFVQQEFVDRVFPRGIIGTIRHHSTILVVALMMTVAGLVVTKVGPVQITVAIAGMSILVGILNAVPLDKISALLSRR